jgi:hypothetical protein
MASFRCRACGQEGTFEYTGYHACPRCGSRDVQFAQRAFDITRRDPPSGISPEDAAAEIEDILGSIGDACPECREH